MNGHGLLGCSIFRREAMSDRTAQLLGAQAMNLDVVDVSPRRLLNRSYVDH